jgi:hypothetical protein
MQSDLEKEYNALLESGALLEMFPDLKGNWKDDKKVFTSQHNLNVDFINDVENLK